MTTLPVKRRKKLIEVAIPLEAINAASAREKSIRHGHPSTLHLWWARRPLAAARAVNFCQTVDDPSAVSEEFPTEEDQENEGPGQQRGAPGLHPWISPRWLKLMPWHWCPLLPSAISPASPTSRCRSATTISLSFKTSTAPYGTSASKFCSRPSKRSSDPQPSHDPNPKRHHPSSRERIPAAADGR